MTYFERLAERFISERRLGRMRAALAERTLWVTPVFVDVQKAHNASAVIRSCDAFGVAEAHFIENGTSFGLHPEIAMGAHTWVRVRKWRNADHCFRALRAEGYRIAGTSLRDEAVTLDALPADTPIAFVFGSERDGLDAQTEAACDLLVRIPMRGFVESLNLSVAAALIMYTHLERIRALGDDRWRLSDRARKKILRSWLFSNTRVGVIVHKKRMQKHIAIGLADGRDED
ncbi:MAG: RNA methyltransferase [Spirochaetota bacterium]|jgi:tRNA (guanosine-2'-O-)-methyltransferase|nr:RNA methyltransferase [Spirochaetota bacterium]